MRYISIDLETTGLNPDMCQVLEFAAVIEDSRLSCDRPTAELPSFTCLVKHENYIGEAYALSLNYQIISMLAGRMAPDLEIVEAERLADRFAGWLLGQGYDVGRDGQIEITVAGKNYATFDDKFLSSVPSWNTFIKVFRRIVDPCTLYTDPATDVVPSGFTDCLRRAGLDPNVKHRALGDAQDVIKLMRYKWGGNLA